MQSKRHTALGALGALLGLALSALALPRGPFEVKSGILVTVSDSMGKMEETLYFDDYGRKEAKYTTTTIDVGGGSLVSLKLEISLPDGTSYNIDLDQKTGSRMKMPPEAAAAIGAAMAPALTKDAKVKDLPAKDFLGHQCKGMEVEAIGFRSRVWTWKGIPLYSETFSAKGGDDKPIVLRATKLTEGPVPADKFKVPAGVEIQDMSSEKGPPASSDMTSGKQPPAPVDQSFAAPSARDLGMPAYPGARFDAMRSHRDEQGAVYVYVAGDSPSQVVRFYETKLARQAQKDEGNGIFTIVLQGTSEEPKESVEIGSDPSTGKTEITISKMPK